MIMLNFQRKLSEMEQDYSREYEDNRTLYYG